MVHPVAQLPSLASPIFLLSFCARAQAPAGAPPQPSRGGVQSAQHVIVYTGIAGASAHSRGGCFPLRVTWLRVVILLEVFPLLSPSAAMVGAATGAVLAVVRRQSMPVYVVGMFVNYGVFGGLFFSEHAGSTATAAAAPTHAARPQRHHTTMNL